ncbi:sporulation histidine kinase inhibitor Sda [Alkalihalobacillus deserti]|nr:sporulation histidine kinase inhibitor Sda [Alkalihalobacillus deserti]
MFKLKNDLLIDAYHKAVELNIDQDFIMLLIMEINRRGIDNELRKYQYKK